MEIAYMYMYGLRDLMPNKKNNKSGLALAFKILKVLIAGAAGLADEFMLWNGMLNLVLNFLKK